MKMTGLKLQRGFKKIKIHTWDRFYWKKKKTKPLLFSGKMMLLIDSTSFHKGPKTLGQLHILLERYFQFKRESSISSRMSLDWAFRKKDKESLLNELLVNEKTNALLELDFANYLWGLEQSFILPKNHFSYLYNRILIPISQGWSKD